MYTIAKRFAFSASHQLTHLPADHPCARLHGHNYEIEVILSGPLGAEGFVYDYRKLDAFKSFIDEQLDHRHLNEVRDSPDGRETTAEALARYLFTCASSMVPAGILTAVRVSETPKTWAHYEP